MKKKISVFVLLLSLMLAVLAPAAAPVPVQAANSTETTADDVKYADIEDFMHSMGYTTFVIEDGYSYFVFLDAVDLCVFRVSCDNQEGIRCFWNTDTSLNADGDALSIVSYNYILGYFDLYETPSSASVSGNISPVRNGTIDKKSVTLDGIAANTVNWTGWSFDTLIYSDYDIYLIDSYPDYYSNVSEVVFEGSMAYVYNFQLWCNDADLNCTASSNESPTKIPYSYNSYWHIVRKTSSGKWLLTTIGNSKNQEGMQLRLSEDNSKLIVYNDYENDGTDSSGNGYLANVRQYEYDTDGWKVRTYETLDFSDTEEVTIELEAGTGLDHTRLLAFTNTDIYSFNGYAILHEASTEYYEVTDTPVVTPEPTPGSGSSGSGDSDDTGSDGTGSSGGGRPGSGTRPSVGGEASGGGGLDFIINLFTLIWTKICAVPMSVDGYSISLQQLFVYGALVSIVGGFIIKFIFRR